MFSDLTLFLLGSGLALFIALLGWSEQIRSTNKETRELENRFLDQHHIVKSEFLPLVKPKSPEDQLEAAAKLMASGKLKAASAVELLKVFKEWNQQLTKLEGLYSLKYDLTIILTVCMFVCGVISLFSNPESQFCLCYARVPIDLLLLAIPLGLIVAILAIVVRGNIQEKQFHSVLVSISERV